MAVGEKKDALESAEVNHIPYWRIVADQAGITDTVRNHPYPGSGTEEDPYVVNWIPNDPRNPFNWSQFQKWFITLTVALATLAVALVSSAYTGGIREIIAEFNISQEVATLGVSLFVLGFAIGPLLWAPLSEVFGRQILFIVTYGGLTAFNAGAAGANGPATLIIMRFFAGAVGSSPLTNAGGVIADMFPASQRGLAMSLFAAAPFLGPVLGPIIGGFLGEGPGWRWVLGFLAAFSGFFWIVGSLLVPETYAPVLLRKRAQKLSKMTGKVYKSKPEVDRGAVSLAQTMKITLSRPWILLFKEPIVLLLSIYMAIIYGTLYMLFAAFPIVYQQNRGWSSGIGGLSFLGIMVGMIFAVTYSIFDNKRYIRAEEENDGLAPPEARLPPALVGSVAIPIGLFWFAWTTSTPIHWMVSIAAGVPFGFGMVLVFLSIMNYLIDAYTIFAASVLAANSVLRSLFGAAFPLFTTQMYDRLGVHWASSVPAFLALACVPFPFLFYKYGERVRRKCHFAAESLEFMRKMKDAERAREAQEDMDDEREASSNGSISEHDDDGTQETGADTEGPLYEDIQPMSRRSTRRLSRATSRGSHASRSMRRMTTYEGNPYSIDRVNTNDEQFTLTRSRSQKSQQ
jgi:multidrug resistance protein